MRTLGKLFVVAAVLVWGSVGQAGSSLDVTLGSLSFDENVVWGGYLSGSWAVAGNDWISQSEDEFLALANTAASAAVSGADAAAGAQTGETGIGVIAAATTGPGSSAAYAYAEQSIWFTAQGDAELQFGAEYSITHLLSSQLNETAFADASVRLSLYREGGMMDTMADDVLVDESTLYVWNFVENGDSLSSGVTDVLSVFGSFAPEEIGYVWLQVDGQATAAAIPAPGALLLGAIGAALARFLRRRVL